MTDWDSICERCGEPLIHHTVYLDESTMPEGAVEGDFGDEAIRGFYCLND